MKFTYDPTPAMKRWPTQGPREIKAQSVEQTPDQREMKVVDAVATGSLAGITVSPSLRKTSEQQLADSWMPISGPQLAWLEMTAAEEEKPENTAVRDAASDSDTQRGVRPRSL